MKFKSILTAALFLGLGATGCGDKFTYNFQEGECSTEEHTFGSKDEYCEALRNHSLNKGCAAKTRKETFDKECPGKSW